MQSKDFVLWQPGLDWKILWLPGLDGLPYFDNPYVMPGIYAKRRWPVIIGFIKNLGYIGGKGGWEMIY